MNPYLKLTLKRYFLILSVLSFSSIILTSDFKTNNMIFSASCIFFYRCNIFSIFALLFSTILTIQTYEKQNVNVAISMSGIDSFKLMKQVFFFSLFLTILNLLINQFLLPNAYDALNKGVYLPSFEKKVIAQKVDTGLIFYEDDLTNFTYVDNEKNILHAKSAVKIYNGFNLFYVDHFKRINNLYELDHSSETFFLPIDLAFLEKPLAKANASLTDLFTLLKADRGNYILLTSLSYRIIIPFLNIFVFFLATSFGFSRFFRKKPILCLMILSLCSLILFYIIECAAILASGGLLSPLYLIILGMIPLIFTPIFSYAKKV